MLIDVSINKSVDSLFYSQGGEGGEGVRIKRGVGRLPVSGTFYFTRYKTNIKMKIENKRQGATIVNVNASSDLLLLLLLFL